MSVDLESMTAIELELRRLPGVQGISFTAEPTTLMIQVLLSEDADPTVLRSELPHRIRTLSDYVVMVEVEHPPVRPERVRVEAVRVDTFSGEVEVHLSYRGARAVGRAGAGTPEGAARATLQALALLGTTIAFDMKAAAVADLEGPGKPAAIVVLEVGAPGEKRYGVAHGATVEEAGCRATLNAVNRDVSRGTVGTLPRLAHASRPGAAGTDSPWRPRSRR